MKIGLPLRRGIGDVAQAQVGKKRAGVIKA